MTSIIKNKLADYSATILALLVAIANSWITIDWKSFEFEKEWPSLLLSAIIAYGGYKSTLKLKQ